MARYFQTIRIVCDDQAEYESALAQADAQVTDPPTDGLTRRVEDAVNLEMTLTFEAVGTLSLYKKT